MSIFGAERNAMNWINKTVIVEVKEEEKKCSNEQNNSNNNKNDNNNRKTDDDTNTHICETVKMYAKQCVTGTKTHSPVHPARTHLAMREGHKMKRTPNSRA